MRYIPGLSLVALLRTLFARTVSGPPEAPDTRRARFVAMSGVADLDTWFTQSIELPVILFLHDPGCPISAAAHRQVTKVDAEIGLIDVRTGKALTRAIEARTGVLHESPQVVILSNGEAVWSASHYAIKAESLEAARGRC